MFERFTDSARRAVVLAQEESRALRHGRIGTEHLLLGLIHEEVGPAGVTLASFGLTLAGARSAVTAIVGEVEPRISEHIPFTPRAKRVLEASLLASQRLQHSYVGSGHLLLGLLAVPEGVAGDVLAGAGIERAEAHRRAVDAIAAAPETPPVRQDTRPRPDLTQANARARSLFVQLDQARAGKDAALDAGDFARAKAYREREKAVLAERARLAANPEDAGPSAAGPDIATPDIATDTPDTDTPDTDTDTDTDTTDTDTDTDTPDIGGADTDTPDTDTPDIGGADTDTTETDTLDIGGAAQPDPPA